MKTSSKISLAVLFACLFAATAVFCGPSHPHAQTILVSEGESIFVSGDEDICGPEDGDFSYPGDEDSYEPETGGTFDGSASEPKVDSLFVPEDQSLFEFVILPSGGNTVGNQTLNANRDLVESELAALSSAAQYWVDVVGSIAKNESSLKILVYGNDTASAGAVSPVDTDTGLTAVARALIEGSIEPTEYGNYLGEITIGDKFAFSQDTRLWALPHNGDDMSLTSVIVHELTHALGMSFEFNGTSSVDSTGTRSYLFTGGHQIFADHTFDVFGTQLEAGMAIQVVTRDKLPETPDGNTFYLVISDETKTLRTGVYFSGQHVDEVLNGARLSFPEDYFSANGDNYEGTVPGLPLNGLEEGDLNQLSHVELQNSLLSHQGWRNWGIPMEAELAMLQDLGYTFDRREHFGWSIYNSGTEDKPYVFINTNPYYDRENGDWRVGTPSDTSWGIGLHVYGSWTDVTQAADILTVGYDATGIRLEGVGNVLTVAENTNVRSDGQYGTGLLVSYGKEHVVNVAGTVTALGDGGIAVRFDFGDNKLGNAMEYRGSYREFF